MPNQVKRMMRQPQLEPLRSDPRFEDFTAKAGLN